MYERWPVTRLAKNFHHTTMVIDVTHFSLADDETREVLFILNVCCEEWNYFAHLL
jgi:hypothetical protein